MLRTSKGGVGVAFVIVLFALGMALTQLIVLATVDTAPGVVLQPADIVAMLRTRYATQPVVVLLLGLSPLMTGVVVALIGRRTAAAAAAAAAAPIAANEDDEDDVPAGPAPEEAALRLLALLQQEARFVDFICEDIGHYDDSQVGAAARTIHSGCRKALDGRITLERILPDEEGTEVTIEVGFDPSEVRLYGNLTGDPPFRGKLAHAGWRAARVQWPESPGFTDPTIITPAEVEIA